MGTVFDKKGDYLFVSVTRAVDSGGDKLLLERVVGDVRETIFVSKSEIGSVRGVRVETPGKPA